jgi:hypothetical protein
MVINDLDIAKMGKRKVRAGGKEVSQRRGQ